jgi:glycosyltransferase involved in cell wall biosynthesis
MKILIAFPYLLHSSIKHGGGQQILRFTMGLHQLGHQIYLLCLSEKDPLPFQSEIEELARYCIEVKIFQRPKLTLLSKTISFLRLSIPPHCRNLILPEAQEYVRRLTSSDGVEVVYLAYTAMGEYVHCVDRRKCSVLVDTIEIETRRYLMQIKAKTTILRRLHALITYVRERQYEKRLLENVDAVIAISQEEIRFIQGFCKPKKTVLVPSLIDTNDFEPQRSQTIENNILFFGSFDHAPNIDAITWFCDAIFPLIQQQIPQTTLNIVGFNSTKKVGRLQKTGITIIDSVPDIRTWILKAAVIISPIVSGGGARIKNIETLAMEKALVTTSLGAEGLNNGRANGYFIEDTPTGFAKRVVELLRDGNLRIKTGETGRKEIEKNHDCLANSKKLVTLFSELKIKNNLSSSAS